MDIQRYGTTRRYSDIVSHNGTPHTVEVPSSEGTDIATRRARFWPASRRCSSEPARASRASSWPPFTSPRWPITTA